MTDQRRWWCCHSDAESAALRRFMRATHAYHAQRAALNAAVHGGPGYQACLFATDAAYKAYQSALDAWLAVRSFTVPDG